ncbi:site-specific integrase [Thermodesulfobacteriota bacterium]
MASPESVQYKKIESRRSRDFVPSSKASKSSPNVKTLKKNSDHPVDSRSLKDKQQKGVSWVEEYSRLENEIHIRHYSPRTLKTYRVWVRKFQTFTWSKSPELLSSDDVKEYLTFLAVKRKVSSATQNQAFNSLLFFTGIYLIKNSERSTGLSGRKGNPISRWYYLVKKSKKS